jgi:energy-coupling factor transporter ATP-binding protein EcfA2
MFKLQRLEISGFKSFADYTELVFTGNGITAIVGPNGCGKSNVSDAISWVLGEQKVKNLRGGEMKDVIFQGSRNRPPSGMAEVVLHMTRDENAVEEPDIEDIDATLEGIDDQVGAVEERLAPELEAGAERQPADGEAAVVAGAGVAEVRGSNPPGGEAVDAGPTGSDQTAGSRPRPRRRRRSLPGRTTSATGGRGGWPWPSRRARASRSRAASIARARASIS